MREQPDQHDPSEEPDQPDQPDKSEQSEQSEQPDQPDQPEQAGQNRSRMGRAPAPRMGTGSTGSGQPSRMGAGPSAPSRDAAAKPSRMGSSTAAGADEDSAGTSSTGQQPPSTGDQPVEKPPRMSTQQRSGPSKDASQSPAAPEPGGAPDHHVRPPLGRRILIAVAATVVVALFLVLAARWLRTVEPIADFIATYSGHTDLPENAPTGFPAWLSWQHFLNFFFTVLIVRTGFGLRSTARPGGYWQAKPTSFFGAGRANPPKITLGQWTHQMVDVLWLLNGLVFVVLLFATGHWIRIVPITWEVFPNLISVLLQYVSLDWPLENSWVHYNAAQQLAYFVTVFIAAPLTALTGYRVSSWWPNTDRANRLYPIGVARSLHLPLALYFVVFVIVHVSLVLMTGALRNLNHMFTGRDVVDAWGLVLFLVSLAVSAAALVLTRAVFTGPLAARTGTVTRR